MARLVQGDRVLLELGGEIAHHQAGRQLRVDEQRDSAGSRAAAPRALALRLAGGAAASFREDGRGAHQLSEGGGGGLGR